MGYPTELRDSIVKRILANEIQYKEAVSKYGIPRQNLYKWVSKARAGARSLSYESSTNLDMSSKIPLPNGVSFTKMYNAYVLCKHFGFESTQAGQLCRSEGLMMEDVKSFAGGIGKLQLTDPKEVESLVTSRKKDQTRLKELEAENRKAQSEIAKKDKVTAELSALLVLTKKAEAIWGDKAS